MPVSVNMPQRTAPIDPLEKLANAVNIAKSIYGIHAESQALEAAKQKIADDKNSPTNKLKDFEAQAALDSGTASMDLNSPDTAQKRASAMGLIGALERTKAYKPDASGVGPLSPIKASIDKMNGRQIDQVLSSEAPLFKTIQAASSADDKSALAAYLGQTRGNNLNERQNQNSVQAGHAWEADPIIKTAKTNLNSLNRSQSILNNMDKPLQSNDLNLAYTDYINSVAAGGSATEGKIHRELPQTFEQDWAALKQRLGGDGDLRKDAQGQQLIQILQQNIDKVKVDLVDAASQQSDSLAENYVGNTNPKVQQVVDQKRKSYSRESLSGKFNGKAPATGSGPGGAMSFEEFMKAKGK